MELETDLEVSEKEVDDLGIKKKGDDEVDDVDVDDDSDIIAIDEDEEKEEVDEGLFGDDKELEDYMLAGYDDKD